MAVAQIESDKLTVTVRKVAPVYLLGGVVELVTMAINPLATPTARRDYQQDMAQRLQMFCSRITFAATFGGTLELFIQAFPTPPALLDRTFRVR